MYVNRRTDKQMWYIYTMEYSVMRNNEICMQMHVTRKKNILNEVTQTQKKKTFYILTHKWLLDVKQRITRLEPTTPEKLVNKENPKKDIHGFPQGRGNRQVILRKWGACRMCAGGWGESTRKSKKGGGRRRREDENRRE